MTSQQYEELCRLFLAEHFRIAIERIQSVEFINPRRRMCPEYAHQIDLYWEIETAFVRFLLIANAKWRSPACPIGMADVLLLQQVKTKVAANQAWLITNTGYSEEARAVAADERIPLQVVKPHFSPQRLPATDRSQIQRALQRLASRRYPRPIYAHEVIEKGHSLWAELGGAAVRGTEARVRLAGGGDHVQA